MSNSVYLSPSTQEDNIGCGNYGSEESIMNNIADVVERTLNLHGVTVYRNNPDMTLEQIVEDSNNKNPDVHFAIHSNAGGGQGCEIFCYKFGVVGEDLARKVYDYLSSITPSGGRGVKEGFNYYGTGQHLYEVTYTNAPAALVEIAFHDNYDDENWIINNIEAIGIALSKGILNYFGIAYTEPQAEQANTSSNILYRVMCGSYAVRDNAENKVQQLKNAGFDSFIIPYGDLYRVICGSYAIRDNANNKVQDLKDVGFDAVVMTYEK